MPTAQPSDTFARLARIPGILVRRHQVGDPPDLDLHEGASPLPVWEIAEVRVGPRVVFADPQEPGLLEALDGLEAQPQASSTSAEDHQADLTWGLIELWETLRGAEVEVPAEWRRSFFVRAQEGEWIQGADTWLTRAQGEGPWSPPASPHEEIAAALGLELGRGSQTEAARVLSYANPAAYAKAIRQGLTTALHDRLLARGLRVLLEPGPRLRVLRPEGE